MIRQDSLDLLRRIPLFQELNEEELKKFEQIMIRRTLIDRMIVFMQGEPLDYIYFVASGKVKTYRTDEQGREQILHIHQTGEMFPQVGFYDNDTYPTHAVMIERGILIGFPTARFRTLLEAIPKLLMKVLGMMEGAVRELHDRLEEIIMNDTYGRIVSLLMRLSKNHGVVNGELIKIDVPFTNSELASMIGTSRETINRTFSQLKKAQALSTTSDHYIILNPSILEKEARA